MLGSVVVVAFFPDAVSVRVIFELFLTTKKRERHYLINSLDISQFTVQICPSPFHFQSRTSWETYFRGFVAIFHNQQFP